MDAEQNKSIVLLSIHPEYANAIMSGRKKVEFRKQRFGKSVDYVVIYASYPVQKIIGYFSVADIETGTPAEIWQRFQKVGGINQFKFEKYFEGANQAVAILIKQVIVLNKLLFLNEICTSLHPPQSITYLTPAQFDIIRDNASTVHVNESAQAAFYFSQNAI